MGTKRSIKRLFIGLVLLVTVSFVAVPAFDQHTNAQIPKLNNIRVALLLHSSGNIDNSVPTVTLSSSHGLIIGVRDSVKTQTWFHTVDAKSVRFSIDQYSVKMLETTNIVQANNLINQLAVQSIPTDLYQMKRQGRIYYQVYAGQFSTANEAEKARQLWIKSAQLVPFLYGFHPLLTGPFHWNAGTYATELAALQHQSVLLQAGLDAYLVYSSNATGKVQYSVWIGEEANQNALLGLKQKALQLVHGLNLQPADVTHPYLIQRIEVQNSTSSLVTHYLFHGSNEKVWITSNQPGITVNERYNHTYRGGIELSMWNSQLAVVNELPFEEYLYAVVGSEMGSASMEALKAQAVASRTYALSQGTEYQIANISDTTYDQAYKGMGAETADSIAAVKATAGQVLVDQNGLITAYYSSNAGGRTAEPSEVWGSNTKTYLRSVPSPDNLAQQGKPVWLHAIFSDGLVAYIHSDFAIDTGRKNSAGLHIYQVEGTNVNVRLAPYVNNDSNPPIRKVNAGQQFIALEQVIESNSYAWIRGPYSGSQLASLMSHYVSLPFQGSVNEITVTKRGVSNRVEQLEANGKIIPVKSSDTYRSMFDHLPSTRFEIEQTGSYTILGANGVTNNAAPSSTTYYAAGNNTSNPTALSSDMFVMNSNGNVRLATRTNSFIFHGNGNGHGIGLSQWGAKDFALLGYDYQYILKYYYTGVQIVKD